MTGGDRDVLHACRFCESDPVLGVKLFWIEKQRQAIVFIDRQLAVMEDPFAIAKNAVHTPVNEHSKLGILECPACL
jgi:hypothetical protein